MLLVLFYDIFIYFVVFLSVQRINLTLEGVLIGFQVRRLIRKAHPRTVIIDTDCIAT